ncbi:MULTISPECIES: methyltransferase domain-containing protein [unclassified Sphingomonas]|jgi:SAM-dependent methyltransferase|uniref:methyltransferase domain-containing protein n=2 Tax=Sphingomonas TaxID=13687 RepID=UPI000B264107|nr:MULTISPECIES: methyltransferase domain-containing protein [unclassified Sphingomonas]
MMSLATRARIEEQMDAPDIAPATYAAVLRDLSRVNWWTRTAAPTLAFLDRVARPGERLRVLDVGFGAGDMLRAVAGWARARDIAVDLVGVDLNPLSADVAAAATPANAAIEWRTGDYADQPGPWDVVISSQVAHHMTPAQLDQFIAFMETTARRGWMISDLHRHRIAHFGYPLLARLLGVHRIVREDGRLSIARSFRVAEWREILARAGVASFARISWHIPFRLCVTRAR